MGGYLLMNRPIKVSLFQYEPNAISSTDWPWTRSGSAFETGKSIYMHIRIFDRSSRGGRIRYAYMREQIK